jgi:spore coat protein A, manganese oxidase
MCIVSTNATDIRSLIITSINFQSSFRFRDLEFSIYFLYQSYLVRRHSGNFSISELGSTTTDTFKKLAMMRKTGNGTPTFTPCTCTTRTSTRTFTRSYAPVQVTVRLILLSIITYTIVYNDDRRTSIFVVQSKPLAPGLMDPDKQPIFVELVESALDEQHLATAKGDISNSYEIEVGVSHEHYTGLICNRDKRVATTIYGFGQDGRYTWPGPTFVITSERAGGPHTINVTWINNLRQRSHLLPLDTNIHWALVSMADTAIEQYGIPISPHLHGGFTDEQYDGNAEAFFTPDNTVLGPYWRRSAYKFTNEFQYENTGRAAPLWYHDHTLGMTRLNVYAGLVGFYIVRDTIDTGDANNKLGLPYGKYELLFAIEDRMFKENGQFFLPSRPGDPSYHEYITEQNVNLPLDKFPGGGPTALAEFFGDFILVNGKIWPKKIVQPRKYRLRLLNGCDSRFLIVQFKIVDSHVTDPKNTTGTLLEFTVIGSDGGLGNPVRFTNTPLVIEPASRYDILIDFSSVAGRRVIMQNLGADEPFGESVETETDHDDEILGTLRYTDRIMAFDVVHKQTLDRGLLRPSATAVALSTTTTTRHQKASEFVFQWEGIFRPDDVNIRELAIMEGSDEFGRIQPILGSKAQSPLDPRGLFVAYSWSYPVTEHPKIGTTEEWYLLNFSEDAHSMHLHLVQFQVIGDFSFEFTIDGTQDVVQHNGAIGTAPRFTNVGNFKAIERNASLYYDAAPKDTVSVLPGSDPTAGMGRGTILRIFFAKLGLYSWHCHILSHEDHEMMRPYEVIPSCST